MKLLGLTIQRAPAAVRIVRGPELLSDLELDDIFSVTLEHRMLRAILQILDTAEDNANRNAATDPANREGYVGGAAQLRLVMDDLLSRQERGKAARLARGGRPLMRPETDERPDLVIRHRTIGTDDADD